ATQFHSLVAVLNGLLDDLLPRPIRTRERGECQRIMKVYPHAVCTFLISMIYMSKSQALDQARTGLKPARTQVACHHAVYPLTPPAVSPPDQVSLEYHVQNHHGQRGHDGCAH